MRAYVLPAAVALVLAVIAMDAWQRFQSPSPADVTPTPTPAATPAAVPVPAPQPTIKQEAMSAYAITGTFLLISAQLIRAGSACSGHGGFSDIQAGKQVTITDATGRVIGIGALDPGVLEDQVTCRFAFTVSGLPPADFYGVEVQRRGRLNFSFDQLTRQGWTVRLVLSSS